MVYFKTSLYVYRIILYTQMVENIEFRIQTKYQDLKMISVEDKE